MKSVLSIILLICPLILFAGDWPGTELPNEVANNKLDMSPLLFIIVSLFIGILTKQFLKKLPIPYTVLLLIIGLVLGVIDRFEWVNNLIFVTKESSLTLFCTYLFYIVFCHFPSSIFK